MTSKRIKKKKTSFVALLLKLFKNREKEVSKNKHYPKHTSSSKGVTYKKERERETKRGGEMTCHFSLSCAKKKIPTLSHEEKHKKQQTSEKEKKRDKTNRRLLLLLRKTETLYTHFGGFILSQEKQRKILFFFFFV